jgi:hypothetical protein
MKKAVWLAVLAMALGTYGKAEVDAEFQGYMKAISAANASLRKNVEAKMGAEAAADAKTIAEEFGKVKAHFEAKQSHAAMMASDAQAAFAKVAEVAATGNMEGAAEALKTAGATCGACHTAHREKAADGSYTIKY